MLSSSLCIEAATCFTTKENVKEVLVTKNDYENLPRVADSCEVRIFVPAHCGLVESTPLGYRQVVTR
jgi:hypothetical protein